MGRSRLDMKYREDRRARNATYLNRVRGAKKKACELSTLCGVDVLFVSFSPDLNSFDFWPEDISEVHRVAARYLQPTIKVLPKLKKARGNLGVVERNPLLSSQPIHGDNTSMEAKYQEVIERIRLMEGAKMTTISSPLSVVDDEPMVSDAEHTTTPTPLTPGETISVDAHESSHVPVLLDDDDIYSSLDHLETMTPLPPISCSMISSMDDWNWCDGFDGSSSFDFLPICNHLEE